MMKRLLTLFLVVCSAGLWAQTQPGSLKGVIKDKITGQTIPSMAVYLKKGDEIIMRAAADFDGNYSIAPITPGTYTVEFPGDISYGASVIRDVRILGGQTTTLNVELAEKSNQIGVVEVVWERPLVEEGKTSSRQVVDRETIQNLGSRDLGAVLTVSAGVFQADEGQAISVRGTRSDANQVFIDGVKVRGGSNVPREAIDNVEVITGGTPAQYGDALGGITNITTRGPQPNYFGGVELVSSTPFFFDDPSHYNLAGLTLGGPIWKRRTEGGGEQTVIGFLLSTEFQYQYEPRPFATPVMRVNEGKLASMEETPIRPSNVGQGVLNEGNFLRDSDLEEIPARLNVDNTQIRVNGNFNIRTSATTNVVIGGRFNYTRGMNGGFASSLMNWQNNSESIATDYSGFARFTQRFETGENSTLKNLYYSIQVDYTRNNRKTWDPVHQDNVFRYGHIGNFQTYQRRFYTYTTDEQTGITAWVQQLYQDTAVTFAPSSYNEVRSNYTSAYYRFVDEGRIINNTFNLNNIRQGGGLINGDNPESIYGLFQAVGTNQAGYNLGRNSQFRVTAQTTFEIGNHDLIAGFEFEQRIDRSYGLAANGLWTQMRLLQNQAILQLDLDNPILVYDENGVFQDTINYNRAFDPSVPRTFDRNVRKELGFDPNGTDYIDIDAYDPDFYSLDMFSADELVNVGGNQYVSYFGYDYLGNIQSGNPTLNDFFTQTDENGNFTRPVPAFQPLYIAGYIQDRFSFRNLNFNVGLRVDRFDANQPVLKDPYSLYPVRTAGEVRNMSLGGEIPNSIGDDYVVYVNDVSNPTSITGYRDGDQWYDAQGDPLANPKDIADISGGQAQPYVIGATANGRPELSPDGFEDYTPQVTFSPRVSFQFPITDKASFFAHYDILVQRPSPGLARFNPFDYLQLDILNNAGFLANPNLKPQRTTDYEIGFEQVLNERSLLRLSAFYKEQRDLIQTVSINEAYPITYVTYGNRDFSTVKGFVIGYELRRTNNILMNANYTLQFADGSGSGPNSGANLARSGQPNLRYILPLDFDTRHQITASIDYRYGFGASYNGPVWWGSNVFQGAGINILARGSSGTPYTARVRAFELTDGASGVPLTGQINGSRQPWIFSVDMTVNKVWQLEPGVRGGQTFELYVAVLNLFDTRNVLNVYAYTGAPDDDGWLASPQGQTSIAFRADAQSYADLYNVAVNSPFNYTLPRRIRLGVRYNF